MADLRNILGGFFGGIATGDPFAFQNQQMKNQQIQQTMQMAMEKAKREAEESAVDMSYKKALMKKMQIEMQRQEESMQPQTINFPMISTETTTKFESPQYEAPQFGMQPGIKETDIDTGEVAQSPGELGEYADFKSSPPAEVTEQRQVSKNVPITYKPLEMAAWAKMGTEGKRMYLLSKLKEAGLPDELINKMVPQKGEEYTLGPGQARFKGSQKLAEVQKGKEGSSLFSSPEEAQSFIESNPAPEGMSWSFKNTAKGWQVIQGKAPKGEDESWSRFTNDLGDKIEEGYYNRKTREQKITRIIPKEASPATSSADEQRQRSAASQLRQQFNNLQPVKDYRDVSGRLSTMEKALEESKKTNNFVAVDQAIITLFNKMTDPQSVVRESEYARTPENLAMWNKLKGKIEKFVRGGAGLTQDDRNAIFKMAKNFNIAYKKHYQDYVDEYRGYAELQKINPDWVIQKKAGSTKDAKHTKAEEWLKNNNAPVTDANIQAVIEKHGKGW